MAIRTMYEISKPFYNFYSVERSGFLDTGELFEYAVTDMIHNGSFTLANLTYNASTGERVLVASWPPRERFFRIGNPGVGYKVGDTVEVPWECSANTTIKVSSIFECNGGVKEIAPTKLGDPNRPRSSNLATVWPVEANPTFTQKIIMKGAIKNSTGSQPPYVTPLPSRVELSKDYAKNYGANGEKNWPNDGSWTNERYIDVYNKKYFVGQEVLLGTPQSHNSESVIPPNTVITSINIAQIPGGFRTREKDKTFGASSKQAQEEVMNDFVWFEFSNPVTLSEDDEVLVRGRGLTINDNLDRRPPDYRVIVEAAGAVDPLNDPVGCFGNVKTSVSNSEFIEIHELQTQNAFRPVIHPGQSVISLATPGSVEEYTTVVEATATSLTTALIKVNKPQTIPAGESLRFVFDEQQPWRVCVDVERNTKFQEAAGSQKATIYVATPVQLQDNGNIANIWNMTGTQIIDRAGILGNLPTGKNASPDTTKPDEGFINRELRVAADPEVYPMNYQLTMTNRGIFFGVWEGTWSTLQKSKSRSQTDKDSYFNWFLVQRPVNRYTGQTLTAGRCPVFCINCVGYKYWQFVVRESDVLHPQQGDPENFRDEIQSGTYNITKTQTPYRVPADAHTQDAFAVLNTTNQIAITEDSKYLISFLHNLASPRFRYSEELDMLGQTSADICMAGNQISINTYNESGPRLYHALPANGPYNTGLRVAALKDIPTDIT